MALATAPALPSTTADLEQLGDEIAVLSAHLDAATARLLTLIREFDARGGWANGFRSCAAWLSSLAERLEHGEPVPELSSLFDAA